MNFPKFFVVGFFGICGCASPEPYIYREFHYAAEEEAMRSLGLENRVEVCWLPEGYKTSWSEFGSLIYLAGISSGNFSVTFRDGKERVIPYYSVFENPEALKRVVEEADVNKDYILTSWEIARLRKEVGAILFATGSQ